MNKWMNEWKNEWMNEWMNEWVGEQVNEWMDERTNRWMNERRYEWKYELTFSAQSGHSGMWPWWQDSNGVHHVASHVFGQCAVLADGLKGQWVTHLMRSHAGLKTFDLNEEVWVTMQLQCTEGNFRDRNDIIFILWAERYILVRLYEEFASWLSHLSACLTVIVLFHT